MSNRNKGISNSTKCKCDKCETEAVAIPGKYHRRCPGKPNLPIRDKVNKLSVGSKGKWQVE